MKMDLQMFGGNGSSETFYQVISKEDAHRIMETGKLTGKEFREVYACTQQPTLKQASQSGARSLETVISFEVHPNIFMTDNTVAKICRKLQE